MHDLATMQQRIASMFPGLMGVRLTSLAPDRVLAELDVRSDLCTAGEILHGGACMAFADALGAIGTVIGARGTAASAAGGGSSVVSKVSTLR